MPTVAHNLALVRKSRRHRWFAAFFAFGATMCALTVALLRFHGGPLDSLWRFNADAQHTFQSLGDWSFVLMLTVGTACLFAAIGLWRGTIWATPLALVILSANIVGDLINALL